MESSVQEEVESSYSKIENNQTSNSLANSLAARTPVDNTTLIN